MGRESQRKREGNRDPTMLSQTNRELGRRSQGINKDSAIMCAVSAIRGIKAEIR